MTDLYIDQLGRVVQWEETPLEIRGKQNECSPCIYHGNGETEPHCLHPMHGPLDGECTATYRFVEVKHD